MVRPISLNEGNPKKGGLNPPPTDYRPPPPQPLRTVPRNFYKGRLLSWSSRVLTSITFKDEHGEKTVYTGDAPTCELVPGDIVIVYEYNRAIRMIMVHDEKTVKFISER